MCLDGDLITSRLHRDAQDGSGVELHIVAIGLQLAMSGVDVELDAVDIRSYRTRRTLYMHIGDGGGDALLPVPLGGH